MNIPLKILIVEDMASDADMLRYEIRRNNIVFEDKVVETKDEYIQAIVNFKPDIILSDYVLPRFSGLQALSVREELAPSIPFILVTGSLNEETAVEIMKKGADDYIIKEHLARIGAAILTSCNKKETVRLKNEAEDKLRVLSMAVDQNPATIIITDTDGAIEYVNPKFTWITGYQSHEVIGRNPRILKSGYTATADYARLWETIKSGHVWSGEFENKKKNGETYFESALISPILDEKGVIMHFLAVKEDITQRKIAQKRINILREAVEQSPAAIIITDASGNIEFVNKQFALQIQYSTDELLGRQPRIFNPGHISDDDYDLMWNNLKSGKIWRGECRNRKKDGTLFWENVIISPMLEEKGKISNYILVTEDITGKMQMLENLIDAKETAERSEKRFHSLFENMIEGFAYCKMLFENNKPVDFIYLEVNHSFEKLTGLKNVTGKKVSEVIPGISESDQSLFDIYGRVALSGKPERFEMYVESLKDWYSISVYSPEKEYFIAVFDVITERKNTERDLILAKEKAEESDRLKTAFLHNISHEIRTPLNAIVGFSAFLGNANLSPSKKDEFVKIIEKSNDQLLAIISGIIALATLDAGQEKIYEEETDINELLKTTYDQLMMSTGNHGVSFSYHCSLEDKFALVKTDAVKLMQVLVNLVGNALKFTNQGAVRFGYNLESGYLEFFVEDTGIGIPEDMHQHIFERFRQVDNSATRRYGGAGLGLSLSKGYVELLGGDIRLESELGKGSKFTFKIPYKPLVRHRAKSGKSYDLSAVSYPSETTVLIVEDDYNNFLLVKDLLSPLKINILHAENGEVAIDMCKNDQLPSLVLMDIRMPVMDGLIAMKIIKELFPALPVIVVTAYANDNDRVRILEAGFYDYIVKPIDKQILFKKIENYLLR
jgi:two-component system, sensor histidine kinase and response regulator